MGELINRAKYEYHNTKASSSGPIGVVDTINYDGHYRPDEITVEADVNEIKSVEKTNFDPSENINNQGENKRFISNESDVETDAADLKDLGEDNNDKKSYKDYALGALDAIETKWDDWFGRKNVDVEKDNLQDKSVDGGDENENYGVSEIVQTQSNDEQIENSTVQPIDNTESDNHLDVKEGHTIPDNAEIHGDFGEETFNNEDQFDEEPGWLESAIDSIVGFFN